MLIQHGLQDVVRGGAAQVPATQIHVLQGDLLGDIAIPRRGDRQAHVTQAIAGAGHRCLEMTQQAIHAVVGHPL